MLITHRFLVQSVLLLCLFLNANSQNATQTLDYLNPNLSFDERADMLIEHMTNQEKISQLSNASVGIPRLHIPQYNWWNECLHGVARAGYATVFPQSITVAASFNRQLIKEIGTIISDEARAKHHEFIRKGSREIYQGLDFWSPNINIFRDPRWGRGHETYGEDPYLTGELASQFILGLQGNDPKYFKTIATVKHFAVHSGPEPLRHTFDVDVSDRDLYETYLPAFYKTVKEAKVYSVMGAYNRFRGESCCGHDFLLNKVLRQNWGFEGYVVSDCGAIEDIHIRHKIASSAAEAASIGLKGGCDLNCGNYYPNLNEALDLGLVSESDINLALKRLLLARFKLGMFDPEDQVTYTKIPYTALCSDYNNSIARKAAQESIVLLKNRENTLPLDKRKITKIAIIGPNANSWESLVGNYHGTPKNPITFLKGLKNKVEPCAQVLYADGSDLAQGVYNLATVPSCYLQTPDGKQGLQAEYFNNVNWENEPILRRIDDQVNFTWDNEAISPQLSTTYAVRWTGYLVPPLSGVYQLGAYAKRGMKVFINDKPHSDTGNRTHSAKYGTKNIALKAGEKYKIVCEYYCDKSNAIAQLVWAMPDEHKLAKAVKIAEACDVAVVVLGLSQRLEGESMKVEAPGFEGGDRISIKLPAEQEALLKAVKATGKPVVLVINAGSAIALNWANQNVDAIINVGYPGEEGGSALADVLFGDYNPAGRLPVTYYKSVEQLPPFDDYNMTGRTYRYFADEPLYPFGYGLSYTSFRYSNLVVPKTVNAGDTVTLSVIVTNSGKRSGDEVVQLYLKDVKASTPRPIHQLEGFERVHLSPGESKTIVFSLTPRQFSMINKKSQRVIEPGLFTIAVGGEQPGFKGLLHATTTQVLSKNLSMKGRFVLEDL